MQNIPSNFSLALGWGAARGLAHIGLIRHMEQCEVRPAEISGTSMGAVIAAFYAIWYSAWKLEEIAQEIRIRKLIDIDFSQGILEGKGVSDFFSQYFGSLQIEDLPIPLTIVATNIDIGERVYFRAWSLLDAVRASISIPGIFAPHKIGNAHFVDGGLLENLPIEAIQSKNTILASSVQMPFGALWDGKTGNLIFSQGTLFSNSYALLRKSIVLMILENERRSLATCPSAKIFHYSDGTIEYHAFSRSEEIIEGAYLQAKNELFFEMNRGG